MTLARDTAPDGADRRTRSHCPAGIPLLDRLEVGPVRLEKRRLSAPYRIVGKGGEDRIDLIYSYEETVFDPDEPESANLAGMIAAQVAVNYGLFFRSIIFHGTYDDIDRRFIRDMSENTAREIYVKKFLEPNPFLVPEVSGLPAVKMENYLQADIRFQDPPAGGNRPGWQLWSTEKQRHCVLSSGGKESLLSFALLRELQYEVHPIFVNESGHHWFTALNAYRYFKDTVAETARVWVNSDRVFNWMLQHLPFIRKNAGGIRSDQYPIRLWTVAVFLFGILPLVRKRGMGRILIGDEYDATVRSTHQGIRHFNGLYDQSLYFDRHLSRYYMRKGWAVSQFSILRPLSEILIEKILAERYSQFQRHQVSCHAAHKRGDRVHPCGKCEKCRRIVAMLKALDIDPGRCGYTEAQIARCLKDFVAKGVCQEEAGRAHLEYALLEKGLIEAGDSRKRSARAHPEVLQLRFHPSRSPMDGIPVDLRRPLFKIYLEHSRGALARTGKKWTPLQLLAAGDLIQPYAFELEPVDARTQAEHGRDDRSAATYLWGELTWEQAERKLQQVDVALLPVGAVEQHGPHLPLDTDAFDADYLARRVAMACSPPGPLVLPVLSYGVSYHHEDFRGTISVDNETLSRLVYDIGMGAARNGIRKLIIINAHGGNGPSLNYAAQMINRDARIFVCVDSGETSDVDIYQVIETPNDVHAGEFETSTSLAVRPHLVYLEQARRSIPEFSSRYLDFTGKRGITWYAYTRKISANGVMGDPTRASVEKGQKIWEIMVAHLVALVEDLQRLSLEEIYHRKL
jgi:creatinine amidohydrolase/Fe(II)-dependent formamide hydrolase-like protein